MSHRRTVSLAILASVWALAPVASARAEVPLVPLVAGGVVPIRVAAPAPGQPVDRLGVDARKCFGNTIDIPWTSAAPLFELKAPVDGKVALVGLGDLMAPVHGPVAHYLLVDPASYTCVDVKFLPQARFIPMKAGQVYEAYPVESRDLGPRDLAVQAAYLPSEPAAPGDLPTVEVGAGPSNPVELEVTLPPSRFALPDVVATIANANRSECSRMVSAERPILRIKASANARVRVALADAMFPDPGVEQLLFHNQGSDFCAPLAADETVSMKRGDELLVFAGEGRARAEPVTTRLAVFATDRGLAGPAATTEVVDGAEPTFVDLAVDPLAAGSTPRPDGCGGPWFGTRPAALLAWSDAAPRVDLEVRVLGFDERASVAVSSWQSLASQQPAAEGWREYLRRPFQCAGEHQGLVSASELAAATYPIWVGVTPEVSQRLDVRLMVTTKRTAPAHPFDLVMTPGASVPAAKRSVRTAFPLVLDWERTAKTLGRNVLLQTLVERSPRELFVFASRDLGPDDLRAMNPALQDDGLVVGQGEPFLVDQISGRDPGVRALDGTTLTLPAWALATTTAAIRIPQAPRPLHVDTLAAARAHAAPEDDKVLADYDKKAERYGACADRVWKAVAGDVPAGYDILVIRGTHTTSVRNAAEEAVWRQCGGAAMEKLEETVLDKLAKTREARRAAQLTALGAIVLQRCAAP